MNLRQRWCGFRGHRSVLMHSLHEAADIAGCTVSVALSCKRCGYRTKWFGFSPLRTKRKIPPNT